MATEKTRVKKKARSRKVAKKKVAKRAPKPKAVAKRSAERERSMAPTMINPAFLAGVNMSYLTELFKAERTSGLSEVPTSEYIGAIRDRIDQINTGDMSDVEGTLVAQATTLDAMFHEFVSRAALNMGVNPDTMETYFRLALRTQGNCRATLQTLNEVKHPRTTFVKADQANIANGHQQVVNGGPSRARENESEQNKLLEAKDGQRLDTRAPGPAGAVNSQMAAMVSVDGAQDA